MSQLTHDLFTQTADDLMSRQVVTLVRDMPLVDAARLLTQKHVSGAPVVDAEGRCVGVLSTADLTRLAQLDPPAGPTPRQVPECVCSDWEIVDCNDWDDLPADLVGQYMTPDPVMVWPETPLTALTRMMVDAHIHRLVVVDAGFHPVGIVSSTDVLAAVARAAQESE